MGGPRGNLTTSPPHHSKGALPPLSAREEYVATNPNPNYNQPPSRIPDPELGPVKPGGGFPWGLAGIVLTIIVLVAIVWYFK